MRWMSLAPLPPLLLLLLLLLPPAVYPAPSDQHPPATDKCGGPDESNLNSFLWTVRRDPPSYFFGTIHVPYTRVWDYIPANAKQAFRQAENVFFELDLTDPYTISALASCQLLPHGENLANVLPGDIYRRLKRHLEYVRLMMPAWMTPDQRGRGLYAEYLFNAIAGNWERKRPVWVMLMVNSLTESDIKARGIPVLDLHLAQEAERAGKGTGAVERVEEQCVPLNELNFSQVVFALNQTLWQHEFYRQSKSALPYTTDDLIDHYNCGDLNSIMFNHDTAQVPNLVNSSLPPQDLQTAKLIDQYFRNELIDKRNQRMAERVMKLLNDHPTRSFFFAFGAGHFLGNNTVIHRLREAGFEVEHTQPGEEIPVYEPTEAPRSKRPGKNILSSVSTHSLLPSDVIYGDIQYLYKKKLRHEKRRRKQRRKHLRQRKRQKQLNSLWESLDPDTPRPWDADRASGRDQKGSKKRKPFNDLWVRMDNEGPNFLHHQFSRSQHAAWQTTLRPHMEFSRYRGSSQASSPASSSLQLLLALSAALLLPRN